MQDLLIGLLLLAASVRSENACGFGRPQHVTTATVDSDGNGVADSTSSYAYNPWDSRTRQAITEGAVTTTTLYVVDNDNPTGFSQVLEEKTSTGTPTAATAPTKTYTLGLDVIAQQGPTIAGGATLLLLYDGHGSTRQLVDPTGQVLSGQVYAYDAFGNPIGLNATSALTSLLYNGEQSDRSTGLAYFRARYYDLATLGGTSSAGWAINASGQVTGNSSIAPNFSHAFLYDGAMHDLGTLGGFNSAGIGINARGQVVGYSDTPSFGPAAIVYDNVHGMRDLNSLIDPSLGLDLQYAYGINDSGQITALGAVAPGVNHAFLLTPMPEPSGLVLAGLGLLGVVCANVGLRRSRQCLDFGVLHLNKCGDCDRV